jgi:pyridoxal/pyridoxine/pyridoxamine kinase
MEKFPCNFTGTGDLFAALVLANGLRAATYGEAVSKTIQTMQDVLKETMTFAAG